MRKRKLYKYHEPRKDWERLLPSSFIIQQILIQIPGWSSHAMAMQVFVTIHGG